MRAPRTDFTCRSTLSISLLTYLGLVNTVDTENGDVAARKYAKNVLEQITKDVCEGWQKQTLDDFISQIPEGNSVVVKALRDLSDSAFPQMS